MKSVSNSIDKDAQPALLDNWKYLFWLDKPIKFWSSWGIVRIGLRVVAKVDEERAREAFCGCATSRINEELIAKATNRADGDSRSLPAIVFGHRIFPQQ
ncbi:MAG: hypothetical protein F2923_08940 [Actinobacteria bacterium]|uniref:Unannotated protein n=1 Tax=freshwater metagenome TaxID=449393 RepID=A0A6J7SQJ8_9ZZZZ|nr:hypothetical protein [Actinomycetota bacterium]